MDDPPIFRELAGVATDPSPPGAPARRSSPRRLPVRAPGMSLLAEFARDVLADHCLLGDRCTCGLPAVECTVIRREFQYDLVGVERFVN